MNSKEAKKVLLMLEKINREIDILGNIITKPKLKPIPVPVNQRKGFRIG